MTICKTDAIDLKLLDYIDCFFKYTTFYEVPIIKLPISILFTLIAAFYFFIKLDFAPIKLFKHAIDIVKDRYTDKNAPGDFTPKQAIYTAALGTVGLGSVGNMAVAVVVGGPGSVFWVVITGFILSILKFSEIALGHKFRTVDLERNTAYGSPFQYISESFKMLKMPKFGKFISIFYAIMIMFAVFFATNMFQCGQTGVILGENISFLSQKNTNPFLEKIIGNSELISTNIYSWILGIIAVILIGMTIMGGMSGVAKIAGALVPFMTISYILSAIIILLVNFNKIPHAFGLIFSEAFNSQSIITGIAVGASRAMFASESGAGTSAIAHSSAKTKEPIMEGCTGFIEALFPIAVCFVTGFIVVLTNAYLVEGLVGVGITSHAFSSVASWFPILLTIQVPFLALTTAIAWGLYGERVWKNLFGDSVPSWLFKLLYLLCTFGGFVIIDQSLIIDLAGYIWISMVVPNVITLLLMRNIIKAEFVDYLKRLKSGEIKMIS
jgi:AGCS family alanine or glycine:cation symporter